MGASSDHDGIDQYAARIIRRKAKQLVRSRSFPECDREDLEQELACDLLKRLPKYNPQRASLRTFTVRLLNHKVSSILENRRAKQRGVFLTALSAHPDLEGDRSHPSRCRETLTQDDYLMRTGLASRPQEELVNLSIDLGRVLASLAPEKRSLCERLLREETILEISLETGIPRTTLYDLKKKLGRLLKEAGLKEYW